MPDSGAAVVSVRVFDVWAFDGVVCANAISLLETNIGNPDSLNMLNLRKDIALLQKLRNLTFWKSPAWNVFGIVLISLAAGSLVTAALVMNSSARADANRVFELRIYHTVPGKLQIMESRFRDTTSKLLTKHNLNVLGYWTVEETPDSGGTFVFLLAHASREEAKKNWEAMQTDPEFQAVRKLEQSEKTLEKAEITFMRPTDFSAMK